MRKIFLLFLTVFGFTLFVNGQAFSKHAFGIRIGDYMVHVEDYKELSYQFMMSSTDRIELGLGHLNYKNEFTKNSAYKLVGIRQWGKNLKAGLGLYVGLGIGVGEYRKKKLGSIYYESEINFIFAGQAGIQYRFISIPILVSLDLRPEYNTNEDWKDNDFEQEIAFSARFTF